MTPKLPAETARTRAEAVPGALDGLRAGWEALGPDHPHHIHVLFAELYAQTTRDWLAALARRDDSTYAWTVVPHFYDIYRAHVLDKLDAPLAAIAPHWRRYHWLARRLTITSPISAHLLLLSLAVRAHVHLDIGVAMHRAEAELGDGDAREMQMFGRVSERAFVDAVQSFIASHRRRQRGWRRAVLTALSGVIFALRPVWIPVLMRWRASGYARTSA